MTFTEMIKIYLPWVLSAISLWMTLMAGNKHPKAWLIGLGGQVLWATWIYCSQTWGMVPMCIGITIMYLRNHFKWNQKPATT